MDQNLITAMAGVLGSVRCISSDRHDVDFADAPDFDTFASSPTTQTLSCDWPRAVLASTISNLRKRKVGKRETRQPEHSI